MNNKGKFIVFEGLDGAGKSTQIKILAKKLRQMNFQVYTTAEPTNSAIGGLIRDSLAGHYKRDLSELAALFMADRIAHNINPVNGFQKFIDSGMIVLCDRYYYSSFAYQSTEQNAKWVMDINLNCGCIRKPDLCIFLDISPQRCSDRISTERAYSEIFENAENMIKVRNNFYKVFDKLGDRENIKIIDASGEIESTAGKILDFVKEEIL